MKIERKVSRWVEQGIISADQADAIRNFEESTGKTRWLHVGLYGFVILGSCVLAIGIISLIAANWDYISETSKLTAAFAVLATLGAGIYWAHDRQRSVLFDVLGTIFVLSCLATIGLIAQVFHTGGEPYQALTFWLVIVLPLSYMGKKAFLPAMWVLGLMVTFYAWALNGESWWARNFLIGETYINDDNIYPLFAFAAMLSFSLASIAARFRGLVRFADNLWSWGLIASVLAAVSGDLYCSLQEWATANAVHPGYLLLPLSLAAVTFRSDASIGEKALLAALLCLSLAIYLPSLILEASYQYSYDYDESFQILGAGYFIAGTVLLALYFAARRRLWLFHAMTVLIGIRFLIIYLQVFEDLAYTGAGLVVSGLLIIGFAAAWYKFRPRLEAWAKGLVR